MLFKLFPEETEVIFLALLPYYTVIFFIHIAIVAADVNVTGEFGGAAFRSGVRVDAGGQLFQNPFDAIDTFLGPVKREQLDITIDRWPSVSAQKS